MMMSYRSNNKKTKTKLFLIILFFIVIFSYSRLTSIFHNAFEFVAYPIWVTESYLDENTINPFGFLVSKKKLIISNQQLKKDIERVRVILTDRNLLLKENLELKEILGRKIIDNMVLASVLNKPSNSNYDSLVIDLGVGSGIKEGDRVFVLGNILIGEVVEVFAKTSKVSLYSSSKEEVNVLVGFNNIDSVAIGQGGGNFLIELPREANVEIGDPIVSPNIQSLILGSVEDIQSSPIDSFKTILFKSPVNLFELKWVQILETE